MVSSAAAGQPHLTILFPAYNEAGRIAGTIATVHDFIRSQRLDAEILVVDDGSSDPTAATAQKALRGKRGRVCSYGENRGKGYAVRQGIEQATGRWVLMSDVDLAAPIEEYRRLAETMRDRDVDLVIGSRRVDGATFEQTPLRKFSSAVFNRVVRASTGVPVQDSQCGFKLLDRERLLPVVRMLRTDGFAFDVEMLFLAHRLGLRFAEVPVHWESAEGSHVRLLRDPARMVLDIARIRWNFRQGRYQREDATDASPAAEPGPTAPPGADPSRRTLP